MGIVETNHFLLQEKLIAGAVLVYHLGQDIFKNPSLDSVLKQYISLEASIINANGQNKFCIHHPYYLHRNGKQIFTTQLGSQLPRLWHYIINSSI